MPQFTHREAEAALPKTTDGKDTLSPESCSARLNFLTLSFSKFGPAQTLDPVSCPPPSRPRLGAGRHRWGPPQSPQKLPEEEILFLLLQAGSYRMFLLEIFGFHIVECSSLVSHRPPTPFPLSQQVSARDMLGPPLPSPPPSLTPSSMFVARGKGCQGAQKNRLEMTQTRLQLAVS